MKNILTFAMALLLMAGISYRASAQEKGDMKLGINAGVALPMGDFGEAWKMGIGGSADFKYFTSEKMAFGANLGYFMFSVKEDSGEKSSDSDPSFSFMPVLATLDYYMGSFYVGVGAGLYLWNSKVHVPGYGDMSSNGSELGIAPSAGILLPISDKIQFNVNGKYNMVFTEGSSTTFISATGGILINL